MEYPQGKRAAVSLTFDDARLSQIDVGMPILDRHGVAGTFYVMTGSVEKRLDGWKLAVARGHEIGNHTRHHPCSGNFKFARGKALEDYTLERMEQELLDAQGAIEAQLGVRPTTFAYPCGQSFVGRGVQQQSYVPLVRKHFVAGRGYMGEVHNKPEYCSLGHLIGVGFDAKDLATAQKWVEAAVEDGGWLILCGHEVGGAAFQTVRADVLDELCGLLRGRGDIWLDTVAAVAQHIKANVPNA